MATQREGTGASASFVDTNGVNGQFAQAVEALITAVQASTYATSGVRYVPIGDGDSFGIQFRATRSGRLWILLSYAMSVANGGTITLDSTQLALADGEDPDTAPSAGSTTTWTPGSDNDRKTKEVDTGFNVVEGDDVAFVFTRNASDTHTGSLNLINALVSVRNP